MSPSAGRPISGERIEVTPPSTSYVPGPAPASAPVTRSCVPLWVVPSCNRWPQKVSWGSARSHRPVVAVSVPKGLRSQPRSFSKESKKMIPGAGVLVGGGGVLVGEGTVGVAVGLTGGAVGVRVGVGLTGAAVGVRVLVGVMGGGVGVRVLVGV